MSAIDDAARMPTETYDPKIVVEAVGVLQGLDASEALDRIQAAAGWATSSGGEPVGLFWVLRVLFDLPDGIAFPPVLIGRPSLPPPPETASIPRFPILLVDDVPLLLTRGYDLAGLPQPVDDHVNFFREHGRLRTRPLAPPASLDAVAPRAVAIVRTVYPSGTTADTEAFITEQLNRSP